MIPHESGRRIHMKGDISKGPWALVLMLAFVMISGGMLLASSAGAELEGEVYITAHFPETIYEETPTNIMVITSDADGAPVENEYIYIYLKGPEMDRTSIFHGRTDESGMLASTIEVPKLETSQVTLEIATEFDSVESDVDIVRATSVLISTDKPLYQPGQTMNIRTLSLGGKNAVPSQDPLRLEIRDADSNLIFRKDLTPNEYGVADTSMPLSDQLNMGTYSIKAISNDKEFNKDVTVERYVLPKFKIELEEVKDWYLIGEDIKGTVDVKYFFGKVVEGDVSIEVLTYYGEWEVVDHIEGTLEDGRFDFELQGPDYAVGIPLNQNNGLVELDVTVTDTAGHSEMDSRMISVSKEPIMLSVVTDSNIPGSTSKYYFISKYGNGQPVDGATVKITYNNTVHELTTDDRGIVAFDFRFWGPNEIVINVTKDFDSIEQVLLLSDTEGLKITSGKETYSMGEQATFDVNYNGETMTNWVYYDVVANGFAVKTGRIQLSNDRGTISFPVTTEMYPLSYVRVYKTQSNLDIVRDITIIGVESSDELTVDITADPKKETYEPYTDLDLSFRVKKNGVSAVSALGVSIVDESVFEMSQRLTGMDRVVFGLEEEFSEPSVMVLGYVFSDYGTGGPVQDMPDIVFEEDQFVSERFVTNIEGKTKSASERFSDQYGFLVITAILLVGGLVLMLFFSKKESSMGMKASFVVLGLAGLMFMVFSIAMIADNEPPDFDGDGITDYYDEDDDNDGYTDDLEEERGTDPLDPKVYPSDDYVDHPNPWGFEYYADHWAGDVDEDGRIDRNLDGIEEDFDTSDFDSDNDGNRDVWWNEWWDDDDMMLDDMADGAFEGAGPPRDSKGDAENAAGDYYSQGGENEGVGSRDRPRQYFPETWYWNPIIITDNNGEASVSLRTPDSITTWKVDATASTKDGLIGTGDASVTVFKDFFIEPDIPVSVVRNDLFPLKVMIYNYDDEAKDVTVTLSDPDYTWFELIEGPATMTKRMEAGEVSSVEYVIKVLSVGEHKITISGTNGDRTDTVIRPMRVVPDGKSLQNIENGKLTDNMTVYHDLSLDPRRVENSEDMWLKLQGGIGGVIMDGAEGYIQFVSGCGEQSMSTLSVDILAYDQAQDQETLPEDMLRYEQICVQGIQHELMYLLEGKSDPGRGIVWFPGDEDVHPWLTSWGLLTFQDAVDAGFTLDPKIISDMQLWLSAQQDTDGSFRFPDWGLYETTNPILQSKKVSTTSYITRALLYSGYDKDSPVISGAMNYIAGNINTGDNWDDPYTLSLALIALEMGGGDPGTRGELASRIAELARTDDNGDVYWSTANNMISNSEERSWRGDSSGKEIECTGYAIMALGARGSHTSLTQKAVGYLLNHRSSLGGFFSTQDTVVAFQALKSFGKFSLDELEITVSLNGEEVDTILMNEENRDMTFLMDLRDHLASSMNVSIASEGSGSVMYQLFLEQYLPWDVVGEEEPEELDFSVTYDTTSIKVNDHITATVRLTYNGDSPQVRMVLIDLRAPVGFSFEASDLAAVDEEGTIDHFEISGRQCVVYIESLDKGTTIEFDYRLRADKVIEGTVQDVAVWDMYNSDIRSEESPVVFISTE